MSELRRRLEGCAVERWDDARARAWWVENGPRLEGAVAAGSGPARTIAVDGAGRAAASSP